MRFHHLAIIVAVAACSTPKQQEPESSEPPPATVAFETTKGKIVLQLSDKTPQHRDNFLKLVEETAFDSLLFHRVINEFMIQGGDPSSKNADGEASLGEGDRDYKVPAEFDPTLFHKRGALGAARDGNAERASSAMQFYIVQRGPRPDSMIDVDEGRINGWLAENYALNAPENSGLKAARQEAQENANWELFGQLSDSLKAIAESLELEPYMIPEAHREVYRTLGGTPHLDQNYTVFGEVIEGMAVVDAIATTPTNDQDRPIEDVRILSARVIE